MNRTIYFLLIIVTFFGCEKNIIIELPITTTSPDALVHYKKAMLSFDVGDGPETKKHLDSALALDPNFVLALEFYMSQDPLIRKEHQELARKSVVNASEAERKILIINESYRNGDMDEALKSAKWLVENHGDSYLSYVWLGQVQSDRYELDDAIKTLKKAIELNPDSYNAYSLLMGHHIAAGTQVMLPEEKRDVNIGMRYGEELIRIRPDHGLPYHLQANCYRQLGEFEKAKPLYEKSIEKRKGLSSEGTAYIVSGHNYMFSGDLKTARERYKSAIEINKDVPRRWFILNLYLTYSYIFDNDYIGAIDRLLRVENQLETKDFDKAGLLQVKSQTSWHKMICYAHNQMEEEAYESLANSIEQDQSRAKLIKDDNVFREAKSDSHFQTAWVNILFGKYDLARKNLEQLKKNQEEIKDPTAMYGFYGLSGMADLMEGNYEGAIKKFLKGNENNIYFNYFKALALKAAGREEEAKNQFTKIANINFSNWNIAIVRRLANKQLGNT
tara:strand:+ start:468 stop:1970 length:1503 start_codon:yes stop_codon:yes gene_type:complete